MCVEDVHEGGVNVFGVCVCVWVCGEERYIKKQIVTYTGCEAMGKKRRGRNGRGNEDVKKD